MRRSRGSPERLLASAGTVVVVVVLLAVVALRLRSSSNDEVHTAVFPPSTSSTSTTSRSRASTTSSSTTSSPTTTTTLATSPATVVPAGRTARIVFVGDDVAQSLARPLASLAKGYGAQVRDDTISGCGVARSGPDRLSGIEDDVSDVCAQWSDTWTERLDEDRPDVVVVLLGRHEVLDRQLDGRWTNVVDSAYADYLRTELEKAAAIAGHTGARVVLLTSPYFQRPPRGDGRQWPENDPVRADAFNALLRQVASASDIRVVELGARTGPAGVYTSTVDGVSVRNDGVHFSAAGAAWLAPWLLPQLLGTGG